MNILAGKPDIGGGGFKGSARQGRCEKTGAVTDSPVVAGASIIAASERFGGIHVCVSQWLVRDLDNPLCLLNQRVNQTFAIGIERNIEMYPDVAAALS